MNRKQLIITLLCIAVVAAAVGTGIYLHTGAKSNKIQSTDSVGFAEEEIPHADPLIVGKWQNTANPHWFKVYYDDFDEDERLFWGKEWDENEDVQEEDLIYHGNGWFRWRKNGNQLQEFHTMDAQDVPIPKQYTLVHSEFDSLVYRENKHNKNVFRFTHVE